MSVATRLRGHGRSVEYALKPQQLARQLKTASSAGAASAVLLLRDQFSDGEVTIKNLRDGSEQTLLLEDFINSQR